MQELALVEKFLSYPQPFHLNIGNAIFFPLRQISDKLVVYQIASEERLILCINEDSNTDVKGFIDSQAYAATATDSRWVVRGWRIKR